jgi:hypothetical protein
MSEKADTKSAKPLKLTESRLRILSSASMHNIGLVKRPYLTGFERVSWDRNAGYLVGHGLLTEYYFSGEYEITEEGRRVHKENAGLEGGR